jgi:RNA polymerase sigma-70 factor (ECF subfamily)
LQKASSAPDSSAGSTLLERLRRRDPAALSETVTENARVLFRAARGLGFPEHEAEDLVQDVFATFLEKIEGFEGKSQLRTWLFGILHRKALERHRAAARDDRMETIDEVFESRFDGSGSWVRPPADIERLMISREIGDEIRDCMSGLPFNQREAFLLREVEELETSEICKILDVSVTNFGALICRARARLRECLETKGTKRR